MSDHEGHPARASFLWLAIGLAEVVAGVILWRVCG